MDKTHDEFMEGVDEKTRRPTQEELTRESLAEPKNDVIRKREVINSQVKKCEDGALSSHHMETRSKVEEDKKVEQMTTNTENQPDTKFALNNNSEGDGK